MQRYTNSKILVEAVQNIIAEATCIIPVTHLSIDLEKIYALIDEYSEVFDYYYLEATFDNQHPLIYLTGHPNREISFYILSKFRFPLYHIMNDYIMVDYFTDAQTKTLLEKYMNIYNDKNIFDVYTLHEKCIGQCALLPALAQYDDMTESVKYLLDIGVCQYNLDKTIYETDLSKYAAIEELASSGWNKCHHLMYEKVMREKEMAELL